MCPVPVRSYTLNDQSEVAWDQSCIGMQPHTRKGGGALALMPRCYAAEGGLIRLVGRMQAGVGALSDTAALGHRGMSVLQRSCSARDEARWCLPAGVCERAVVQWR